jgi:hypothetical protein
MSKKKVTIGIKPMVPNVDKWVNDLGNEPAPVEEPPPDTVPMKRLTLDIPASLHRRIKTSCAQRGVKMAEEMRSLFEKNYGTEEQAK